LTDRLKVTSNRLTTDGHVRKDMRETSPSVRGLTAEAYFFPGGEDSAG
jgi:hypothetical protein